MIDTNKWNEANDELKMMTVKVIKSVMSDNAVTKSDSALITDYLLNKVQEDND